MKQVILTLFVLIFITVFTICIDAQQVNTLYFIENVPIRQSLNPAFQPFTPYFISLPVIGFAQFSVGNNSLTFKDLVPNYTGQSFNNLQSNANVYHLYSLVKPTGIARADFQINILSFGFRHKEDYWSVSLSEKLNGMGSAPKDAFQFLLYGTNLATTGLYDFSSLQTDVTAYTEAAFGFSRKMNNKLTVGARLKFLYGNANVSNSNSSITLTAKNQKWTYQELGTVNISAPTDIQISKRYDAISISSPKHSSDWLKPAGLGTGLDLGVNYKLNDHISLSAALTDLGFIRWTQHVQNLTCKKTVTFTSSALGYNNTNITNLQDFYSKMSASGILSDSLKKLIQNPSTITRSKNNYNTATTAKLNLGFEYSILDNKLGFGLLSYSQFFKETVFEELTGSVNARPTPWFNVSLSYSAFNARMGSIGAGIGLKTGILHWLLAADYIPFRTVTMSLSDFGTSYPNLKIPVPYNSQSFNLAFGMNLVLDSFFPKSRFNKRNGLYHESKSDDCHCGFN